LRVECRDNCGTNSDPAACRAEPSKAYQEQQKMLLDVLAAMNGQPKAEQKKMYQQMRLNNRLMVKKTKDEVLTAKTPSVFY